MPSILGLGCNNQWRGCYLGGDSLWDPQEMGVCSWSSSASRGDESAGLHLEEQKDRRSSVGSLPGFLAGVACGLAELARSPLNITHEICFISSVYDHIKLTFVDAVR